MRLGAPVVLIFFNRPSLLAQVWESIDVCRPDKLIAISDGPKQAADIELVRQCREIVKPNWKCEFATIYADENLGCRLNVSQGLSTVFQWFEEAIVLEDDCLPDPSFFGYCAELLERYRYEEAIFSITGLNQFEGRYEWSAPGTYAFSRYFCTWGWASWRRSWQLCRWDERPSWTNLEQTLTQTGVLKDTAKYWCKLTADPSRLEKVDSWGYQFCMAGLIHKGLTIFPQTNCVSNIGLTSGVHYKNKFVNWKMPSARPINLPLKHPDRIAKDDQYDTLFESRHFDPNRLRRLMRRVFFG